jgi:ABC-type uncharacterized transport system permease subunit
LKKASKDRKVINVDRLTQGEYITLDNNKEYFVVEIVEQEDKRYLYLVSEKDVQVVVAEEIIDGDDIFVETIDDKEKITEIVKIVTGRLNQN